MHFSSKSPIDNNFQGVKFAKNITNDNLISINAQHLKMNLVIIFIHVNFFLSNST